MSDYFLGVGSLTTTDIFALQNSVQNTQIFYPKQLVIATLRDIFSQDTTYHYVKDAWGFPLVRDLTDIPPDAGLHDDVTTRIWIGENFKKEAIFYPSVVVRNGGSTSVPIGFNFDKDTVLYGTTLVGDGYGNFKQFITPIAMVLTGAWEGSINIDVYSRGVREMDDIVEIISMTTRIWRYEELRVAGLLVKRVSAGSVSETDDRNDKLYKTTISLDVRSEWRIQIPVENVVDAINICVELGHTNSQTKVFEEAPNIEIHEYISILDAIESV